MPRYSVIIPAAGASSRFTGFAQKKPFVSLQGRPVWLRTVELFARRDDVCEVVLVLAEDDLPEFREKFAAHLEVLDIRIAEGGATRADSVRNGLKALSQSSEFVAVHDAARPLLSADWITSVFEAAAEHGAAIPGLPVTSTVKKVNSDGFISQTVDRTGLFLAQTPQVFSRSLLERIYDSTGEISGFTDDASMVEASGHPVRVVQGWGQNIKITTAEDFRLAERLLDSVIAENRASDGHP